MVVLLTSFATWLPHQISNSSDDLLAILNQDQNHNLYYLRKLPVNTNIASQQVITKIQEIQPQTIICCGMAETRDQLTIESNAKCDDDCQKSQVNLTKLVSCLTNTSISHDAGNFVCEGLYYQVLSYLSRHHLKSSCLFVHVPILNTNNTHVIYQDFTKILKFVEQESAIFETKN